MHKKLLVVVVADAAQPDVTLQARRFGAGAAELHHLAGWLEDLGVVEAVMESTAQYWKPVWMELEPHMRMVTRGRLQLVRERVHLQTRSRACWKRAASSFPR